MKIKFNFKKKELLKKLKNFFQKLWQTIYKTVFTFNLHAGTENAGYLAFAIMYAIFPFMIFFTIIIGYFGQTDIGNKLINVFESTLPKDIIETILPVIDNVVNGPKTGILSIATLTLIWSASSLVQGLKTVLDRAFRIKINKSYFFTRLGSIIKFLLITVFVIGSIFITIIFPKILFFINHFVPINYNFGNILILFKPFLLIIFTFIFIISIYYIIPSRRNSLKNIFWGSLLTLIGWFSLIQIFTFYLQKIAKFQVIYGSLAGIIITLFFFHIMAVILIFGAEFNYNLNEIFRKKKKNKNNTF